MGPEPKYKADRFKLSGDVARTISTFTGSAESIDRRFAGTPTINFDLEKPQFDITGLNPNDPNAFLFQGLFENNQRAVGRDWQARLDAQYDFDGFLKNIQIGGRYTDRNASRRLGDRYTFLLPLGINASALPVDFDVFRAGFRGSDIQPFRNFTSPTYSSIRDNVVRLRQFVIDNCAAILPTDPANNCRNYTTTPVARPIIFRAKEETMAGYGQVNFGTDALEGTAGLRVVHLKRTLPDVPVAGGSTADIKRSSTAWLPNVNLQYRFTPQALVRVAVSKTRTEPNFSDLGGVVFGPPPSGTTGTSSNPYSATGGNPFLNAFTSWNYDASLEYYFARAGFASVAVFHRDLNGFIQQSTATFNDPNLGVVRVTGPINTGKGRITGAEAQFQAFLDFSGLPEWATGFGVQANVTYLDAKTQQANPNGTGLVYDRITDQVNGVSKWNYNLVALYEKYGLSTRLTYNGRSHFQATRQPRGDDFYYEIADPASRLDLSVNYDVLPQTTLFFDWTNITNTPHRQYLSSARAGADRAVYVRYLRYDESTMSLGVRFRF